MPRTFRELIWAYRGHEYAVLEKVAQVCAAIFEVNRDPKRRSLPFTAEDFFRRPGVKKQAIGRTPLTGGDLKAMKLIFAKKRTR
jgi:predicted RNA-binding protein